MDNCEAIAYRFATAFGLSPRLRLDLLVNDFTNKAINDKYIVVYESHFMRTFIHVHDIARSFMFGIRNRYTMRNDVYNVGSDDMNFSKADVCKMIKNVVPYHLHLADIGSDADQRDYVVSYSKVKSMGFRTKIPLDAGIKELADGIRVIKRDRSYSNV
jgi:nucleoside-diphosphate-sugar epimerase